MTWMASLVCRLTSRFCSLVSSEKRNGVPKETITLPGVTRKPSFFSKMLLVPEMATGTIGALAFYAIFKLPPLNSPM